MCEWADLYSSTLPLSLPTARYWLRGEMSRAETKERWERGVGQFENTVREERWTWGGGSHAEGIGCHGNRILAGMLTNFKALFFLRDATAKSSLCVYIGV